MRPPVHPKIASSCASVAPLSAARVAAALRKPCAERRDNPAALHAFRNSLPKLSLVRGLPRSPQIYVRSPHVKLQVVDVNLIRDARLHLNWVESSNRGHACVLTCFLDEVCTFGDRWATHDPGKRSV